MNFSVLMSVYIKESPLFLEKALESLLNQTLRATEVVLVEDGPLSNSLLSVIDKYRVKLNIISVKNNENQGLAISLNNGLEFCNFELVIRMDTDDISRINRFETLVAFMENNPDISVCSSALSEFDDNGVVRSKRTLPLTHDELVKFGKLRSPISHAAAIFRKTPIINVGGYPLFKRSQDVALWSTLIMNGYKLANLKEDLFLVRAGDEFMKRSGFSSFKYESAVINYQYSIGYLTFFERVRNLSLRFFMSVIPVFFKRILYARAKK
ncbi:glycosyltransferase [Photobacterium swingsii]|uniref:glycosyltransferase n=1 Tax=Photobacterium swingsii TaxID=680026 RepID=UPI004067ECF1